MDEDGYDHTYGQKLLAEKWSGFIQDFNYFVERASEGYGQVFVVLEGDRIMDFFMEKVRVLRHQIKDQR
tara:strand:+ start:643 stop:849 length:207 start_codon:yes stop_codon:yes gene_type:complete